MKIVLTNVFVVVAAALLLPSCMTTKVQQHNLPCHDRTVADVVRSATSILVMNGFRITHTDTIVGLVQAQTDESHDIWSGAVSQRVWQIVMKPELKNYGEVKAGEITTLAAPTDKKPLYIIATAKVVSKSQNAYGATLATSEVYYDDNAHKDWEWYWDVRKGLEQICGATAVITTKKMN